MLNTNGWLAALISIVVLISRLAVASTTDEALYSRLMAPSLHDDGMISPAERAAIMTQSEPLLTNSQLAELRQRLDAHAMPAALPLATSTAQPPGVQQVGYFQPPMTASPAGAESQVIPASATFPAAHPSAATWSPASQPYAQQPVSSGPAMSGPILSGPVIPAGAACSMLGCDDRMPQCGTLWSDGSGRLLDNLSFFGGLDGAKQPQDLGINANFGGRASVNFGVPIWERFGLGAQIGTASVWSDNAVHVVQPIEGTASRYQSFTTVGLFQRTDWGLVWGLGYDFLADATTTDFFSANGAVRSAIASTLSMNSACGSPSAATVIRDRSTVRPSR